MHSTIEFSGKNFHGFPDPIEMLNVNFLRYLSLTSHMQKNDYMYVCM